MGQDTAINESDLETGLRGLIGYSLKRAASMVTGDTARVLDPMGLRITTYSALSVICRALGVTQTLLAGALAIERSNSVAILDQLEKSGWIARHRSDTDRRAIALHPTPAGVVKQTRATKALHTHEARMFANLSAAERAQLVRLLSRIQP